MIISCGILFKLCLSCRGGHLMGQGGGNPPIFSHIPLEVWRLPLFFVIISKVVYDKHFYTNNLPITPHFVNHLIQKYIQLLSTREHPGFRPLKITQSVHPWHKKITILSPANYSLNRKYCQKNTFLFQKPILKFYSTSLFWRTRIYLNFLQPTRKG